MTEVLCTPHRFILSECRSCREQARQDALREAERNRVSTRRATRID